MSAMTMNVSSLSTMDVSPELSRLREKLNRLPDDLRKELVPLAEEALDATLFRSRVLDIAREGLERYRLDLAIANFDLEATRRERELLRRKLESLGG